MNERELEARKLLRKLRTRRESLQEVPLNTSDVVDMFELLERRRKEEQEALPKRVSFDEWS